MLYIKKEKKNILSIYFFEIKFEIFFNIIYVIETKKTKASENFINFSQWPHSFLQYTLIYSTGLRNFQLSKYASLSCSKD